MLVGRILPGFNTYYSCTAVLLYNKKPTRSIIVFSLKFKEKSSMRWFDSWLVDHGPKTSICVSDLEHQQQTSTKTCTPVGNDSLIERPCGMPIVQEPRR